MNNILSIFYVCLFQELLCDVQGKENKINDLNCDAQKLNSMINSYHILQQSCSLINLKSQLRDDIEVRKLRLKKIVKIVIIQILKTFFALRGFRTKCNSLINGYLLKAN